MAKLEQLLNKYSNIAKLPESIKSSEVNSRIASLAEGSTADFDKIISIPGSETTPTSEARRVSLAEGDPLTLDQSKYKIPPTAGYEFDKALGMGSWVKSGIEAYKSAVAEVKTLNKYLNLVKTGNVDLPQAFFYAVNAIRRSKDNPVKLPDDMSQEDWNILRSLIYGKTSHDRLFKNVNPIEWLDDKEGKTLSTVALNTPNNSSAYKKVHDPYSDPKNISTPEEIKQYLSELNFGYKKWAGFEIGTDHLWDIKMRPYHHESNSMDDPSENHKPINKEKDSVFGPFPTYSVPRVISDRIAFGDFSFGEYLPAISYNLQFGSQIVKDIPLYNNSKIQFPVGFAYDITMSIDIIDDVYHSMKKYLAQCLNNMYDLDKNEGAPPHRAAWIIELTVYRAGFEINYKVKLIGCPVGYSPEYQGQNEPQESRISLNLGIIGIITKSQNKNKIGENKWESGVNWTEVTLNPNGGVNFGVEGSSS